MRINDVVAGKDGKSADERREVVTVHPDATVRDLLGMLAEHNIGALVVSVDGSHVDGIVSERDVVRRLHGDERLLDRPVSDIMSTEVRTCRASETVDAVMALMTQERIRHVPVVEDDRLTGIVSIGDVVKSRMSELQFERDQLDSYVHQS
ncbi:MAG TPA: CBS domain-containing protein [Nocardioidaceae bacterium]|nr:CBS domain-containing protein [Nocardioidaceae bacterium]